MDDDAYEARHGETFKIFYAKPAIPLSAEIAERDTPPPKRVVITKKGRNLFTRALTPDEPTNKIRRLLHPLGANTKVQGKLAEEVEEAFIYLKLFRPRRSL